MHYLWATISALIVAIGLVGGILIHWQKLKAERTQNDLLWNGICKDLAHQMGTPLSALMGWLEMLPTLADPHTALEEMRRNLDRLKVVGERLTQVGSPNRRETVSLAQAVSTVQVYFSKRLPSGQNAVILEKEISGDPLVRAQAELLDWIMEMLVKESIGDLTEAGGKITLRAYAKAERGILEIENEGNNGDGHKANNTSPADRSILKGGRSPNLPLAKFIVENNFGGLFQVQPAPMGHGTTISIYLKLVN